jgi:hypothetical protein
LLFARTYIAFNSAMNRSLAVAFDDAGCEIFFVIEGREVFFAIEGREVFFAIEGREVFFAIESGGITNGVDVFVGEKLEN